MVTWCEEARYIGGEVADDETVPGKEAKDDEKTSPEDCWAGTRSGSWP